MTEWYRMVHDLLKRKLQVCPTYWQKESQDLIYVDNKKELFVLICA